MRTSLLSGLLVLSGTLFSQCNSTQPIQAPRATASSVAPATATESSSSTDTITVYTGQAESMEPDPNKPYREMAIEPLGNEPTNYTAFLICKRDSFGVVTLKVKLNPSRHSIEKVSLGFGMSSSRHTAEQITDGVGYYDAERQRYYFAAYYQVISQLSSNQYLHSELYPVHGWVSTSTNTLGLRF
ncbi:hypothetical protein [Hymenobacter cellulosivorans]|uniref:Uncharacterized protein n=1 Tax=Hymenobacter cellulosivorans TaxID=2932249 RepID=A0ABY4F667_9BACT|nr:hypothetical protein [Hymenobacter cellulosivorans]UOQ51845.1 hypothetical protein MUN80_19030 [Hymenobacter cellulosivorans]